MITTQLDGYGKRLIGYGLDLVYPRSTFIGAASALAAWYGSEFSMTYARENVNRVSIRFISSMIQDMSWGIVTNDWANTFAYFALPVFNKDYTSQYMPHIHFASSLGAAITVSMTLNLVARAVFGTKSNKDQQIIPLVVALGVPASAVPTTTDTPNATVPPEPRPAPEDAVKSIVITESRNENTAAATETPKDAAIAPEPRPHHPHKPAPEDAVKSVVITESRNENTAVAITPTESKEFGLDDIKWKDPLAAIDCCWYPTNIVNKLI